MSKITSSYFGKETRAYILTASNMASFVKKHNIHMLHNLTYKHANMHFMSECPWRGDAAWVQQGEDGKVRTIQVRNDS
jgi:hypothetical protein